MFLEIPNNPGFEQNDSEDEFELPVEVEEHDPDFTEYLWMENVEEFDKQELQRLQDEEMIKECMEAMLDHELEERLAADEKAEVYFDNEIGMFTSSLNPLADEFVPASLRSGEEEVSYSKKEVKNE